MMHHLPQDKTVGIMNTKMTVLTTTLKIKRSFVTSGYDYTRLLMLAVYTAWVLQYIVYEVEEAKLCVLQFNVMHNGKREIWPGVQRYLTNVWNALDIASLLVAVAWTGAW